MLELCYEFTLPSMVLEDFSKEKHCFVSLSLSIGLLQRWWREVKDIRHLILLIRNEVRQRRQRMRLA